MKTESMQCPSVVCLHTGHRCVMRLKSYELLTSERLVNQLLTFFAGFVLNFDHML